MSRQQKHAQLNSKDIILWIFGGKITENVSVSSLTDIDVEIDNSIFKYSLKMIGPGLFFKHKGSQIQNFVTFVTDYLILYPPEKPCVKLIPKISGLNKTIIISLKTEEDRILLRDGILLTYELMNNLSALPGAELDGLCRTASSYEDKPVHVMFTDASLFCDFGDNRSQYAYLDFSAYSGFECSNMTGAEKLRSLEINRLNQNIEIFVFNDEISLIIAYCFIHCSEHKVVQILEEVPYTLFSLPISDGIKSDLELEFKCANSSFISSPITQPTRMRFNTGSFLPQISTTGVKIIDLKEAKRTVFISDRSYLKFAVEHRQYYNEFIVEDKQLHSCFEQEIKAISTKLAAYCDQEVFDHNFSPNEPYRPFEFTNINDSAFFNDGCKNVGGIKVNKNVDEAISAIGFAGKSDINTIEADIISELSELINGMHNPEPLSSGGFLKCITVIASVVVDGSDRLQLPGALEWFIGAFPRICSCFPLKEKRSFDTKLVIFISRLVLVQQLSRFIEEAASDTQWLSDVFNATAPLNSQEFVSDLVKQTKRLEQVRFCGSFSVSNVRLNLENEKRFDLALHEASVRALSVFRHGGTECEPMIIEVLRNLTEMLSCGLLRSSTGDGVWSFLKRSAESSTERAFTAMAAAVAEADGHQIPDGIKAARVFLRAIRVGIGHEFLICAAVAAQRLKTHSPDAPLVHRAQLEVAADGLFLLGGNDMGIDPDCLMKYRAIFD